jgi:hypothetical protein
MQKGSARFAQKTLPSNLREPQLPARILAQTIRPAVRQPLRNA